MRKILITGSSGFIGSEICSHLSTNNDVATLNRNSGTYKIDLANEIPKIEIKFDIVIHCAGLAHQNESLMHFLVNVNGTKNLLSALEANLPTQFVFISTIAVYGAKTGNLLNEETQILASDSYGKSKIQAETEIVQWCAHKNVKLTILRLPLIVGKNAPGNLKDMIRAIQGNYYFNIAGGHARRSMVIVNDIALHILRAAEVGGTYNLSDGYNPSFAELSKYIVGQIKGRKFVPSIPYIFAQVIARIGDLIKRNWFPINSIRLEKLTQDFTVDDSLARNNFGWSPEKVLESYTV